MSKNWKFLGRTTTSQPAELWKFETPKKKVVDIAISQGKNFVVVFALTPDKKVVLVHEYYFTAKRSMPKLVAGRIDQGERPRVTAIRELLEETGCKGKKVISLGHSLRGKYVVAKAYHFLILDVQRISDQNLEESEDIEVKFFSLSQFKKLLFAGRLYDMINEVTAYRALKYLKEL